MSRRSRWEHDGWGWYSNGPTKAQKQMQAANTVRKLEKKGKVLHPVVLSGTRIAASWWGKAWCANLERYADYANRIGRGKSYVRSGAVLDLVIENGRIDALVQGSRKQPYVVTVTIAPLSPTTWRHIVDRCNRRIDTLESLANGTFPKELEDLFFTGDQGLFPAPKEIGFSCSCPDWASMCKHVAAVLYGTGNRLDADPLLFFTLRNIDMRDLIKRSVEENVRTMLSHAETPSERIIPEDRITDLFGV